MKITRINDYDNPDFEPLVLFQHCAYYIDEVPCSIKIIDSTTAIIDTNFSGNLAPVIDEFRIHAYNITNFYTKNMVLIESLPEITLNEFSIDELKPSQFYINELKLDAIKQWLNVESEVIIAITKIGNNLIIADGHTRLFRAKELGYQTVKTYFIEQEKYLYDFYNAAQEKEIYEIKDLQVISNEEYLIKWLGYCKQYFEGE